MQPPNELLLYDLENGRGKPLTGLNTQVFDWSYFFPSAYIVSKYTQLNIEHIESMSFQHEDELPTFFPYLVVTVSFTSQLSWAEPCRYIPVLHCSRSRQLSLLRMELVLFHAPATLLRYFVALRGFRSHLTISALSISGAQLLLKCNSFLYYRFMMQHQVHAYIRWGLDLKMAFLAIWRKSMLWASTNFNQVRSRFFIKILSAEYSPPLTRCYGFGP